MPVYALDGRQPRRPDDGSAWIAPSADVIGEVVLAAEVSIWFGAVVRADNGAIQIGARSNVQDGAMLHSDPDAPLTIGAGVTIGHHAILHGCTIGDHVLVGMGATVLNHAVIGADSLIGAGALVTEGKAFPAGSLIVGAPARVVRALSEAEIARLRQSAAVYCEKRALYAARLEQVG
ncbi:MAG TPA: gamma carbonic anhydrase family protein [Sphingomonas sp.]|jgi:carbonic anhydrase/acetyltransferase-like protein (isoleucine patch superfamily)|uniref:gamma carbonic anhydrase family protein n=1 Tax=Sphingomonas sp. TaxID=28214 RepID=UPI002ED8C9B0